MKNIKILLLLLALVSFGAANSYEYPVLYKDPKVMGMGGANVALGGSFSSLFYNTAGLSNIPKEYGYEIGLLGVNLAGSDDIKDLQKDLKDAGSDEEKILKVVQKYQGKNNHISLSVPFLSIAKKFNEYAFGVSGIGGLITNTKTHSGFGTDGILETNGLIYYGAAAGLAKDIEYIEFKDFILNKLSVGVGGKFIKTISWNKEFTLPDLIDNKDDFGKYLQNDLSKKASSFVLDLGLLYQLHENIQGGISVQNIGTIGSANGIKIPTTASVGLGYIKRYNRVLFSEVRAGADYFDVFYANADDKDFVKRTRLGVGANIIEGWLGEFGLQTGLYQGSLTFGVNARLFAVNLAYATYQEQIGVYQNQEKDRRHIASFSLAF